MRDLIELTNLIDRNLPPRERRAALCDLLLRELQTLKGRDLEPYLAGFVFDTVEPGTKIVLKFPIGTHVFDSGITDRE